MSWWVTKYNRSNRWANYPEPAQDMLSIHHMNCYTSCCGCFLFRHIQTTTIIECGCGNVPGSPPSIGLIDRRTVCWLSLHVQGGAKRTGLFTFVVPILYFYHKTHTKMYTCTCRPLAATTNDNRLRNCPRPIGRSIRSWPICFHQVCGTSFRCSTSRMWRR